MNLSDFFKAHPKAAVAYSGGVDSSYLLYEAKRAGAKVTAYFIKSEFQPEFELEDAVRFAVGLKVPLKIITVSVLADEKITSNTPDRCYHCKKRIFSKIIQDAGDDGFEVILDGTNASDDASDRPGMKVLEQYKVLSPLRLCGLTKDEIRRRSKDAGLFTWDKPSYSCLATRIRTGETITLDSLERVEKCERYLMDLGFTDFRVRSRENTATIQLIKDEFSLYRKNEDEILKYFRVYFDSIVFDENGRG